MQFDLTKPTEYGVRKVINHHRKLKAFFKEERRLSIDIMRTIILNAQFQFGEAKSVKSSTTTKSEMSVTKIKQDFG